MRRATIWDYVWLNYSIAVFAYLDSDNIRHPRLSAKSVVCCSGVFFIFRVSKQLLKNFAK